MNKKIFALATIFILIFTSSVVVYAADSVEIDSIKSVYYRGDTIKIRGTTTLDNIFVQITPKGDSTTFASSYSKDEFEKGISIIIPDTWLYGQYTVQVGNGPVKDTAIFELKEKVGNGEDISVTGVSLDKSTLTLYVGDTYTLKVTIKPSNATNKNVTWESDNTSVATVDQNGEVKAKKSGKATITVTTEDGGYTDTCVVTVKSGRTSNNDGGGGGITIQSVSTPYTNPAPGIVEPGTKVALFCATTGATIYYTLDGSTPTVSSTRYTSAIEINEETVIKAIAVKAGMNNSAIMTAHFAINKKTIPTQFNDISSYGWAQEAIDSLASKGIIKGISQNEFGPERNIKRADFMLILIRMLGMENESFTDNFSDIPQGSYYYNAIGVAKAKGFTTGVGNNNFAPEQFISRQDMFVITYRILLQLGKMEKTDNYNVLDQFVDSGIIADYAKECFATFVKNGIVKGSDNKVNPNGNATRAETAVFVYRISNIINK